MLKRLMISFVVLLLLLTAAGATLAQEQSGLRFVCITGLGCAHTPLTDQDLELAFPDQKWFESAGDYAPEGTWLLGYSGTEMVCNGMAIPVPGSEQPVSFSYYPREDGEDEETLLAEGLDEAGAIFLDRLGPGVFAVTFPVDTGQGGAMTFSVFLVMTSDFTMDGMLVASGGMEGYTCFIERDIFGSATE